MGTDFSTCVWVDRVPAELVLVGELDLASFDEARRRFDQLLAVTSGCVRIDLSELTFIDSTGLRFVVGAMLDCEAAGRHLEVRRAEDLVHRVFTITKLDELLPFV